jgi:Integrase core domain
VLGVKLTRSQPGRPMGRGKAERVIETIQQQFMVEVTGDERHPARHPVSSLEELNGLLDAWVRTVYHARVHSETGETPQPCYVAAGPAAAPDPGLLRHAFAWCPMTTKIAQSMALTCGEETSLSIHGGSRCPFCLFRAAGGGGSCQ